MNTSHTRFSWPAIVLHWVIAVLLLCNIWLAWRYEGDHGVLAFAPELAARGLEKFNVLQLHKSIGITVLVLSVLRLAWRFINPPPRLPDHMKPWERRAAHAVHWAFYAVMIGLPLTGWILVSASPTNLPTVLYKHIPWPHIGCIHDLASESRKAVTEASGEAHELLGFLTYGLIILHVGAAVKHQFIDKDGLLGRMAPFAFLQRTRARL